MTKTNGKQALDHLQALIQQLNRSEDYSCALERLLSDTISLRAREIAKKEPLFQASRIPTDPEMIQFFLTRDPKHLQYGHCALVSKIIQAEIPLAFLYVKEKTFHAFHYDNFNKLSASSPFSHELVGGRAHIDFYNYLIGQAFGALESFGFKYDREECTWCDTTYM